MCVLAGGGGGGCIGGGFVVAHTFLLGNRTCDLGQGSRTSRKF